MVLTVTEGDADNLIDWLAASDEVYYDLEREVLLRGQGARLSSDSLDVAGWAGCTRDASVGEVGIRRPSGSWAHTRPPTSPGELRRTLTPLSPVRITTERGAEEARGDRHWRQGRRARCGALHTRTS